MKTTPLWSPCKEIAENSRMWHFMAKLNAATAGIASPAAIYTWRAI